MRRQRGLMRCRSCSVVSYRVLKTVLVEGCCVRLVPVVFVVFCIQIFVWESKELDPPEGGKAKS